MRVRGYASKHDPPGQVHRPRQEDTPPPRVTANAQLPRGTCLYASQQGEPIGFLLAAHDGELRPRGRRGGLRCRSTHRGDRSRSWHEALPSSRSRPVAPPCLRCLRRLRRELRQRAATVAAHRYEREHVGRRVARAGERRVSRRCGIVVDGTVAKLRSVAATPETCAIRSAAAKTTDSCAATRRSTRTSSPAIS